jgi:DNA-nicking Smr family endonuclease
MARKNTERRRSTNKYEALNKPEDILDFHTGHSITSQEVKHRTIAFINQSVTSGYARVRIVIGKGNHSRGAPTVAPQVNRTLKELMNDGVVIGFRAENDHDGGEGALRVDLKT